MIKLLILKNDIKPTVMYKWIIPCLIILCSCKTVINKDYSLRSKLEVIKTEKEFKKMAKEKGVAEAFYFFADEKAVIKRENKIIKGPAAIKSFYNKNTLPETSLQWTPDFVEVSASGDLAYTYGKFTYSAIDSNGKAIETNGIFHTVWKKQKDGTWKYVWD